MVHGSAIFLCSVVGGALAGTLVGAIILKVSCALYNVLANALAKPFRRTAPLVSESVPETRITTKPAPALAQKDEGVDRESLRTPLSVSKPSLEWAMCIVFVNGLINLLAYLIFLRLLRLTGQATGHSAFQSMPPYLINLVFIPLSFLIQSGMYAAMLPTSFGKGLLVTLIYLFLSLLIAAVVVSALALIALVFGLGIPRLV